MNRLILTKKNQPMNSTDKIHKALTTSVLKFCKIIVTVKLVENKGDKNAINT